MTKRYSTPFTLQAKAQDAVDYDIVPGERYIRTDGSGTVRTSSINVTAYKKVGTKRTVIVSARNYVGNRYKVQYRVDGGSWNDCDRIDIPSGQFMALGYGVPASGFSAVSEDVELRLVDTLPDPDTVLKDGILIPVVHDGASGTKYQRRYKSTNSATAPDVITDIPSAWSATPTAISSVQRYRYVSERSSDDGGVTWGAWSPAVVDAYFAEDGRSISIKGSALGVIAWGCSLPSSGMAEGDTWLMNNDDADDYNTYVSGLWEGYAATLEDGYLVDGHLWVKERNAASSSLPRWKDTGVIQGPRGEDALVLTLSVTPDTVRLTRDHAGVVMVLPGNVTLSLVRSVGSNQQQLATVPVGYKLSRSTDGGTTWTDGVTLGSVDIQQLLGGGTVGQVLFALRSTSDTVADTCGVTALWEQHRMLIPAGEYTDKEYRRTANTTPLLHCYVSDSLSEYWYLVGDTNDRGAGASPRYAPPSDQYPAIWAQASEFEVVLTKMLFADFARLGSFVVCGRFFLSQYGTLFYNNNGTVQAIGVGANNYETQYGGKVPFAWFDDEDPVAATSPPIGSYKFRPTKLMVALTGEEWMGEGRVHISDEGVEIEGSLTVSDTGNMYDTVVSITTQDWGNGIDFITREANGSTIVQRMQLCGGRGSQYVLPDLKLSTPIYVSGRETPAYDNYVKIDVNGIEMAYNHPTGSDIGASDEVLTIRHDTGLRIGIERKSKGSVAGSELTLSADGVLFQLLKFEKVGGHMTMQYPYQDSLGGTGWNSVSGYGYLTLATGKYLLLYCGMVIGVSTTRPGSGWTQMDQNMNPEEIL